MRCTSRSFRPVSTFRNLSHTFWQDRRIDHGQVSVYMEGARHLLGDENFAPKEAVYILSEHCMNSEMIVHFEGTWVRVESVDLKVW